MVHNITLRTLIKYSRRSVNYVSGEIYLWAVAISVKTFKKAPMSHGLAERLSSESRPCRMSPITFH